ncbi:MAG: Zn-dependent hydrolase [Clostridia bacterium]|nr:Zn-dependent hydrolase [Clostridia bacterium]
MKRTFTTTMPDRAGAFLKANECISRLGLNITRVSYNKAVDTHMLFLEVEGEEPLLDEAEQQLAGIGYLHSREPVGSVLLLEFQLKDEPGTLHPVLRLIEHCHFNISYISSQEDGSGIQRFKMGLFVENGREVSAFMRQAAMLCPVKVIDYDKSEKVLDNTVFYLNFAHEISEKMGLSDEEKAELIIQSNRIMQMLDERNSPAYKTFDYIRQIAGYIQRYKGENFNPRITHEGNITLIEPPCGSNLCVLELGELLLCFDCGFACYRQEQLAVLRAEFPGFDRRKKVLALTHPDVDHCGCTELFDEVYLSHRSWEDFQRELAGQPAYREENPLHAPYGVISKLLSGYRPPKTEGFHLLGKASGKELLERLEDWQIGGLCFEVYEGLGGHVKGETVYLERQQRLVFTGDIFVNIKGFTKEQARFNRLAPYLMTSVDSDPAIAKAEREAIFHLLDPGEWRIIGAHGSIYHYKSQ